MATPEAQEAAAKERIIKHMNADHGDSVRRYLEAFANKAFYQVKNARMTDITLNDMKFSCGGQQTVIPFDPPMKSLREARERLVQLDKDTLTALGRSDISITKFIPPYVKPGHLFNFSQCLVAYIVLSREANLHPGSLIYDNIFSRLPNKFTWFVQTIRLYNLAIMIAIHVTESVIMSKKVARHGLTPFDRLWWLWVGTCFVEGITSFWRLDDHIAEKKAEKEAKKH